MRVLSLSTGVFVEERVVELECVVDSNEFGEVIAIEILDPSVTDSRVDWRRTELRSSVHVAYDADADAVSIRVIPDQVSSLQAAARATLHIDDRQVVRLISLAD
jgi:uncharacterized protein YuzE